MQKSVYIICTALVFLSASTLATAKAVVTYPQPGDIYTKHHRYPIELLELALSYHTKEFAVVPSKHFMTQGRAVEQLKRGKDIDVLWTMTSVDREDKIQAIRIPIYKGLIGWRLFLTNSQMLANQKHNWNLKNLRKASMIQGHDWPDYTILAENEFNVVKVPNYEGLFQLLSLNRADLFPRSIIEIWDELESYRHNNIAVEPNTLISYPTATYFFVSPDNTELAAQIENGLQKSIEDGQFTTLFNQYYSEVIKKANLDSRVHFRLSNPLLPEATPLEEKYLWFSLEKD